MRKRAQADRDDAAPPELDENDTRERRRRIRRSRDTVAELARAAERSKDLREQVGDELDPEEAMANRGRSRLLAVLLGVLGVALLAAGLWLAAAATPVVGGVLVAIGAVMFTAAVLLFIRGRSPGMSTASPAAARVQRQIRESDEQLTGIQSRLDAETNALGLETLDADTLVVAEEELDAADARLREWQQMEAGLAQATERAERQIIRREGAQQSVQDAQASLEAEERTWQAWLHQRSLLSAFSPDSIQELRTLVDLARTHHREMVAMGDRIGAIETDIDEFIDVARPMAQAHGFEVEWGEYTRVAGVADDIIDLHQGVSEAARTRADIEKELEEAEHELAERQKSQQKVADEIAALLKSGPAEDGDDFRRRDQVFRERAALTAIISSALEQMQRISGPGDALEGFRTTLAKTDIQTIRDVVRERDAELEEVDEQRSELDTERGAIQTRLDGLASEEDSSRLRLEGHRLGEEFAGPCARLGGPHYCREPDQAGTEQVREGAPAGCDPPRPAFLP